MTNRFWTAIEVSEFFQVEERFLTDLEEEEIICPVYRKETPVKVLLNEDLEKVRLAKILVEEMGVNLAGVEVILRMRQSMLEMRKQFDDILEDLAGRLRRALDESGQ
jgi:MerR family transcriptional regulator/heat shock protein HspR